MKPLILVTNDDGMAAKGIAELVDAVKEFGDVVVVAADKAHSGMSHAITVKEPLRIKDMGIKDGVHYFLSNGTPVDCVKLALQYEFKKKPDFIVSGINHGENSSTSVHYSGTMGAAREGCINGIPSVGFSLLSYNADADFSESKRVVKAVMKNVLDKGIPDWTYLNVNIPDTQKVEDIKMARMAHGKWVEEFIEREDPRGGKYYWLSGHLHNMEAEATDTDEYYLANNIASIVPCKVDVTDYNTLNNIDYSYGL